MSAPDCTCAIVWDAFKQAEVIRKCALCRASTQMYEALEDWLRTDNRPETINPAVAKTERALAAARGETERVR